MISYVTTNRVVTCLVLFETVNEKLCLICKKKSIINRSMNRELTYNNGIAMFWKSVDILKHCTQKHTYINKKREKGRWWQKDR